MDQWESLLDWIRRDQSWHWWFSGIGVTLLISLVHLVRWLLHRRSSISPSLGSSITANEHGIAAGGDITATALPGGTAIIAAGDFTIDELIHIKDPLRRDYVLGVLRDLSFLIQEWKNRFSIPKHEYSEVEWKKYEPLFERGIIHLRDKLEHFVLLHSSVLQTDIKNAVRTTIGNLKVGQIAYMSMPIMNGGANKERNVVEDKNSFFKFCFQEVVRILSSFEQKVVLARKSLESSC